MKENEIIETLKATYSREIRKQLIKTILQHEKESNQPELEKQYQIINQIFSYVLHEMGWNMGDNSQNWDNSPLEIMIKAFPKIETTKWYSEQNIDASQNVNILMK